MRKFDMKINRTVFLVYWPFKEKIECEGAKTLRDTAWSVTSAQPSLASHELALLTPISHFYIPWKREKTKDFSGGYRNETFAWKKLVNLDKRKHSKKRKGGSGEKSQARAWNFFFLPTFKFVRISFCTWKPSPLGLGNCSVPNFC